MHKYHETYNPKNQHHICGKVCDKIFFLFLEHDGEIDLLYHDLDNCLYYNYTYFLRIRQHIHVCRDVNIPLIRTCLNQEYQVSKLQEVFLVCYCSYVPKSDKTNLETWKSLSHTCT